MIFNSRNDNGLETWIPVQLADGANVQLNILEGDDNRVRSIDAGQTDLGEQVSSDIYFSVNDKQHLRNTSNDDFKIVSAILRK